MDEKQAQALEDVRRRVNAFNCIKRIEEETGELAEIEQRIKLIQQGEILPTQLVYDRDAVKQLILDGIEATARTNRFAYRQFVRIANELHIQLGLEEEK